MEERIVCMEEQIVWAEKHLHMSTIMRWDTVLTQHIFNDANSTPFEHKQIVVSFKEYAQAHESFAM